LGVLAKRLRPPSLRFPVLLAFSVAALSGGVSVAQAETVGRLYTAVGSGINEFDVGPEGSLTSIGVASGGPTNMTYPGSIAMVRTADGESLYELAGSGSTETIYQYSVDTITGLLSAKSPATIATIPLISSEEQHMIAVFNPAAHGEAGQNALYVLSGPDFEHAYLYMFDIDPVTGVLSAAGEIPVRGMYFGGYLAYSGKTIVVEGAALNGTGFQNATIEPASGIPVFPWNPYVPCPEHSCDDGRIAMLDPEHVLDATLIPASNPKVSGEYVGGFQALAPGAAWLPLYSTPFEQSFGPVFTAGASEYLVVKQQESGTTFFEGIEADGLSEGHTLLAGESTKTLGVSADFALGSDLFIANVNEIDTRFTTGGAYRLSPSAPPEQASVNGVLGDAMTGFLLSEVTSGGSGPEGTPEGGGGETGGGETGGGETGGGETGGGETGGGETGGGPGPVGTPEGSGSKTSTPVPPSLPPSVPAAGNTSSVLQPPATKIVSVKIAGAKTTIKFKGSGGYGKLTFRCRFGTAKKAVKCKSPLVLSHLAPGKHRFSVYAVDSRPVADPTPAQLTFRTK
jgi:hypothetical protein